MRGAILAAGVLAATAVLTGCGGSESDEPASTAASEAAGVGWTPCDRLTADQVSGIVGETVTMTTGTTSSPRCAFLPEQKGAAAFEISYVFFDGGLDNALTAMGAVGTQLEPVDVDGATSARLAVRAKKSAVAVTGFVETDGLVQSVNAAQLAPYDADELARVTTDLLAALAGAAPDPADA